jgi:hypothetical protein
MTTDEGTNTKGLKDLFANNIIGNGKNPCLSSHPSHFEKIRSREGMEMSHEPNKKKVSLTSIQVNSISHTHYLLDVTSTLNHVTYWRTNFKYQQY